MLSSNPADSEVVTQLGLEHRVHLPERQDTRAPLLLLVHGRAGSSQVPWIFSKAAHGLECVAIAPQAPISDERGGYSWWPVHGSKPSDDREKAGRLDEVRQGMTVLERFIAALPDHYPIDPSRIVVIGFSQGAALLGSISIDQPGLFQGAALLSGFIPSLLREEWSRAPVRDLRICRTSYFVYHGEDDDVVPYSRGEESVDFLQKNGCKVHFFHDATAHKVSAAGMRALTSWLSSLWLMS